MNNFNIKTCDLDVNKYEPDVQNYIKQETEAEKIPMFKDDIFINSLGIAYKILEDAPQGCRFVRVKCNFNYGSAIREIPKIILIS